MEPTRSLNERNLPDVLLAADGQPVRDAGAWRARRAEVMRLLEDELFGRLPDAETAWHAETLREESHFYQGGKAIVRVVRMTVTVNGKPFSWDFHYALPKREKPVPVFLLIGFGGMLPLDFVPTEEICDGGFGVARFDYSDISADNGDFTSGLSALFYPDGKRGERDSGKIALWAWAASRVMDYLVAVPEIDPERIVVVGHSRLGKTALWASARDERVSGVVAVQSGCSGASIARGNTGETVADITGKFPHWFAPAYARYAGREAEMPFDQHFLLALTAPRALYVSSAAGDLWADPVGEYLGCLAVSPVYALFGLPGVDAIDAFSDDMTLHGGRVAYHRREGTHFVNRQDWQRFMAYFQKG